MHSTHQIRTTAALLLAAGIGAGFLLAPSAGAQTPNPPAATAAAARGTVTIRRGFNLDCYNAIPLTVFVDGKPVGAMGVGQDVKLRVLPGTYRIGVALGGTDAGASPRAVAVDIAAGNATTLLANAGPGGSTLRALSR